jgi:hypothetical protein
MSISFVGLGYALLLQHLFSHVGLTWLADVTLHYVTPTLGLLYWLLFVPKRTLRWSHALAWSSYIVVYAACVLVRGHGSGFYPYPFIDITALGLGRAVANGVGLLLAYYALAVVFILGDRRWP